MNKPMPMQKGGGGATPERTRTSSIIKVVIADDHAVVREGLAAMIGREGDMKVVAEAKNGLEAVRQWSQYRPDVLLLDLRMPELDGVTVIQQIRAVSSDARIVVLTTFDSDEYIYRARNFCSASETFIRVRAIFHRQSRRNWPSTFPRPS